MEQIILIIKGTCLVGVVLVLGVFADIYGIYSTMVLLVVQRLLGFLALWVINKYLKI